MTGATGSIPAHAAGLERLILTLADSKRLLGIRYSDWLLGAPSIETGIAASSMCQDEWGHARLLYAMLKELDRDPREVEHERPSEAYASVDALDVPFESWAEFVAAAVLVDGAITTAVEGFGNGRFELAGNRVPKMLAEEEFHADFAHAWYRKLAKGTDEAKDALIQATQRFLPRVMAWVAPSDDLHQELAGAGFTDPADDLAERFAARVSPVLQAVKVDIRSAGPEREGWDAARGRGPGHPDEESVERARGDRNRALFVE